MLDFYGNSFVHVSNLAVCTYSTFTCARQGNIVYIILEHNSGAVLVSKDSPVTCAFSLIALGLCPCHSIQLGLHSFKCCHVSVFYFSLMSSSCHLKVLNCLLAFVLNCLLAKTDACCN